MDNKETKDHMHTLDAIQVLNHASKLTKNVCKVRSPWDTYNYNHWNHHYKETKPKLRNGYVGHTI